MKCLDPQYLNRLRYSRRESSVGDRRASRNLPNASLIDIRDENISKAKENR